ncbi:hypothetical protein AB5I39_02160 [Sphingomonas sp. MMS24-J45]|uniref:hypothetical protein n=1 Tax=Sphingomonas sp. MMS24-J45 TaxID=3238806 RepID=UPI00384F5DF7
MRHGPPPASSLASPQPEQLVTSSDLVRHFGVWQERAVRAPLYILHRGRPRFVLTSIETMDALCAAHAPAPPPMPPALVDATILLDGMRDLVVVADAAGTIIASSRTARAHFGTVVALGGPIDLIAAPSARTPLSLAIRRVLATGSGDRLEMPSAAREGRTLTLAIEPAGTGVVLFAQDGTPEREAAQALATLRATDAALAAATGVASVTINPRGYPVDPGIALASITGLTRDALAMIRFVSLAEIGMRVSLGAAIERAMAGETPPPLHIGLLVNRADPITVRVGLAPLRIGTAVEGVTAVLVAI